MVRRLLQLYVGLGLYGLSTAMFIRSDLGVDPWDVFHLGVGLQLGMTIGTVIILTGAAVLLLWIPLRQMPGLGTLSNVVCIGLAADASMALIPELDLLPIRIALLVGGHCAERDSNRYVYRCRVRGGPTRWTDDRHSRPAGVVNPQRSNLN